MTDRFDVLLIAASRRDQAEEVIALAGGRLVETLDWSDTGALMGRSLGRPVLALAADGISPEVLEVALPDIRAMAEALDLPVVVKIALPQIDAVAGPLLGLSVEILCEPDPAEWVGALAIAGRHIAPAAGGRWRENEAERLKKLNDEVARIAETLARLVGRDDGGPSGDDVADRRLAFGFAPPEQEVDPQAIRQAIRGRRMRDGFFGKDLFGDPAWDMLLDLYAAHLEGVQVSVSSLCIAAAVAPTTALRWITRLTEMGVFARRPDAADRRRAFLTLSDQSLAGMNGYVAAMRRAALPFA